MIGVNANVQAGDSGGSLVNSAGQVLGIDTAGSSGSTSVDFPSESSSAEAFAVPIDTAMSIANQIESGQGTSTIHVGTHGLPGGDDDLERVAGRDGIRRLRSGSAGTAGVTVAGVVGGGAAAQAGLAQGDVITSFDGQTLNAASDLAKLLVPLHPGDKVQVGWVDSSGQSHTGTVDLGAGPPA